MRATILPLAVILTAVLWALVSMMAKECFLFLLPNNIHVFGDIMQTFNILTRRKYCNRNTPNPQYSPLLTYDG